MALVVGLSTEKNCYKKKYCRNRNEEIFKNIKENIL